MVRAVSNSGGDPGEELKSTVISDLFSELRGEKKLDGRWRETFFVLFTGSGRREYACVMKGKKK